MLFNKKHIHLVRNFVCGTLCNVGVITKSAMGTYVNFYENVHSRKNTKIFTRECSIYTTLLIYDKESIDRAKIQFNK